MYEPESFLIRGAVYEVYKEKGCGFLEPVYQECLEHEFAMQKIQFRPQPELPLTYKGIPLRHTYRPDFICMELIIVELKAVSKLLDEHRAQVHNYLKATGLRLGFLVNFAHHPKVEIERIVV